MRAFWKNLPEESQKSLLGLVDQQDGVAGYVEVDIEAAQKITIKNAKVTLHIPPLANASVNCDLGNMQLPLVLTPGNTLTLTIPTQIVINQ